MKNLKSLFGVILLCVLSVCFISSCEDTGVKAMVEIGNAKCPMSIENGMTMTEVNYKNDVVECVIEVDEKVLDITQGMDLDVAKQAVVESMKNDSDIQEDPLMEAIVKEGKSLRYTYVGKNSGQQYSILVTANDYKK